MRTKTEITQEDFSRLLAMLAPDTDEAAQKYEEVRRGLIKFFYYRGCLESESLADETINRVALKSATVKFDGNVKLTSYFYAFAANIFLEDCKERKEIAAKAKQIADQIEKQHNEDEEDGQSGACLEKCLRNHPPQDRELLLDYYRFGKAEKREHRKKLAETLGINIEYLHTKVSRLRREVGKCLRKCLNEVKL